MNKTTTRTEYLTHLKSIYRLLGHFYRKEITLSLVEKMERSGLLDELERLGYDIESSKLKDEAFLHQLAIEYARVFIGPGKHVSPYGSIYHPDDPKKGRLWGDTTTQVRRFVMDHGLEFEGKAYDGVPDHISHELEFFSRLVEQEAIVRQVGEKEKAERLHNSQNIFFNQHLKKWVPALCTQIQSVAKLPFYKEIARLTNDIIDSEKNRLVNDCVDDAVEPCSS